MTENVTQLPITPAKGGYDLAQQVTGLKRGTLHALVSRRKIPHTRLGPRLVVFDKEELRAWMAEQHARLTGAAGEG